MYRTIAVLLLLTFVGCGPRTEVAIEKAQAKIDALLGSMDVKRKEIEIAMRGLDDAITGIKKAKIKAQVKQEQIDRKAEPTNQRIAQADATLMRLRPLLEAGEPAEIAGKTYTADELKEMASKVLAARKAATDEVAGFDKSKAMLARVVTTLDRKLTEYESTRVRLESQLAEIDANTLALKAMQDASAAMGDSEATFDANLAALEDKIADLTADVQVELAIEDDKWQEEEVAKIDAVDQFIAETQEPSDPLAEIQALFGESQ